MLIRTGREGEAVAVGWPQSDLVLHGGETTGGFYHHALLNWCWREKVSLTRCRSSRKNDQAPRGAAQLAYCAPSRVLQPAHL